VFFAASSCIWNCSFYVGLCGHRTSMLCTGALQCPSHGEFHGTLHLQEQSYATALVGKHWGWFGSMWGTLVSTWPCMCDLQTKYHLYLHAKHAAVPRYNCVQIEALGACDCACIVSGLNCWCGADWALVFLHHYIYSVLCACGFSFIHRAAAENAVWGLGSNNSPNLTEMKSWDLVWRRLCLLSKPQSLSRCFLRSRFNLGS